MNTKLKATLVITLVLALFGLTAAQAQKDSPIGRGIHISDGPQLEIFVSSFASEIPKDASKGRYEPQFGLRGSFHLSSKWVVEGSISRYGNYDIWFADASAKYYLRNRGRVGAYLVGGPGMRFGSDAGKDKATVHLGVGLEIPIGQRFYLRPEVRGMSYIDDLSSADASFSLGVGWRM